MGRHWALTRAGRSSAAEVPNPVDNVTMNISDGDAEIGWTQHQGGFIYLRTWSEGDPGVDIVSAANNYAEGMHVEVLEADITNPGTYRSGVRMEGFPEVVSAPFIIP